MNLVSRPCFDAGTGQVPCVCRWQADEGWQSASRLIRRVEVKGTPGWQGWAVFPNGVFPASRNYHYHGVLPVFRRFVFCRRMVVQRLCSGRGRSWCQGRTQLDPARTDCRN